MVCVRMCAYVVLFMLYVFVSTSLWSVLCVFVCFHVCVLLAWTDCACSVGVSYGRTHVVA